MYLSSTINSVMPDGEIVAFGARFVRSNLEEDLTNHKKFGFVPTELVLFRSRDDGHTWNRRLSNLTQNICSQSPGPSMRLRVKTFRISMLLVKMVHQRLLLDMVN